MRAALLAGLDIGTTGVKGIILETGRGIVAQAWREQQLLSPHPGWAEMSPAGWWTGAAAVLRDLVQQIGDGAAGAAAVAAVGVSGMVPALVLLDEQGVALRRSIQQNDARTAAELSWLRDAVDAEEFFRVTGGSVNQQLIAPKLRWLLDHEPAIAARTKHILGSCDYVNYMLTDSLGVEANWALESGLADIVSGQWYWPYVSLAGLGRSVLPPIRQPSAVVGTVTPGAAAITGLKAGTPVVGGAADHVASAFAAGLTEHGDLHLKLGGAGDILFCLDQLDTDPRLFIDYHLVPGKYFINGCMASSGSVVKWFADRIAGRFGTGETAYAALDAAAAQLVPSSDSLILLPYFLGEKTPVHDPSARGALLGLSLHHGPEHIHRAILEAVVFGFRHHLDILAQRGHQPRRAVITDGGARSGLWRQIAADVLQMPIEYQAGHPGSALGAAFAAGIGCGAISDWTEIRRYAAVTAVAQPRASMADAYDHLYRIYRDVYPALRPAFAALAATPAAGRQEGP